MSIRLILALLLAVALMPCAAASAARASATGATSAAWRPSDASLRALGAMVTKRRGAMAKNELARRARLISGTVRRLEAGRSWVCFVVLGRVASALQVDISVLTALVAPPPGKQFHTRMQHLRVLRGHSLQLLSAATGLSATILQRMEQGKVIPGQGEFDTLVRVLSPSDPNALRGDTNPASLAGDRNRWVSRPLEKPRVRTPRAIAIGAGVRTARERLGRSPGEVVQSVNASARRHYGAGIIDNYESGRAQPSPRVGAVIEGALGRARGSLIKLPAAGRSLPTRLRFYLAYRGLTRVDLARIVGMHSGEMIGKYLRRRAVPPAQRIAELAVALDVSIAQLTGQAPALPVSSNDDFARSRY